MSNSYVTITTITFATSATSTTYAKLSGAVLLIYFLSTTGNPERHLVTCSERVKHLYPKKVEELRETLFDKLNPFMIPYKEELQFFTKFCVY